MAVFDHSLDADAMRRIAAAMGEWMPKGSSSLQWVASAPRWNVDPSRLPRARSLADAVVDSKVMAHLLVAGGEGAKGDSVVETDLAQDPTVHRIEVSPLAQRFLSAITFVDRTWPGDDVRVRYVRSQRGAVWALWTLAPMNATQENQFVVVMEASSALLDCLRDSKPGRHGDFLVVHDDEFVRALARVPTRKGFAGSSAMTPSGAVSAPDRGSVSEDGRRSPPGGA